MTGYVPDKAFNEQLKKAVRESERRVRSQMVRPGRWHKKGSGSGSGEIIKFDIDTVDCTDPANPVWLVDWTHYSQKCKEPPGVDEYTGLIEVEPPCNVPFTDEELELNGKGFAVFLYPRGENCNIGKWHAFDPCADNGCDVPEDAQ